MNHERSTMNHPPSTMNKLIALSLIFTLSTTFCLQGKAYASHFGAPSSAGGAAAPAGRVLESFHSDLATGRSVLSIPLAVPPGRRGVQPGLALGYSSSSKNGPVGVGWALELGSVERSMRFGLPKFDNTDTYLLKFGGVTADLVQVAPGEFRPKDKQLFAKILFTTTRWTVTAKDGTVATFGATADARQTVSRGTAAWLLNEIRDIHGNGMTISYTADGGQVYPASIRYTDHPATGLSPLHEIRFTWESRPDKEWDHRLGDRIVTERRLQAVEAFSQGALVRRYTFTYASSPLTGRSLLTQVSTFGSDGTSSLPPLSLTYSNAFGGWLHSVAWKILDGATMPLEFVDAEGKDIGMRLEDVTGDGRPDLLQGFGATLKAWLNSSSGWIDASAYTYAWRPPIAFTLVNSDGLHEDMGGRFADLNGDGRVDLIYSHQTRGGGVYLNTGSGWQETSQWALFRRNESIPYPFFVSGQGGDTGLRLADLNADGKTDLLQGMGPNNIMHAYLNTGSGWAQDDRWAPPSTFIDDYGRDMGCRLVDLNGDGLTDLFYAGLYEKAVYLNTGSGWQRQLNWNAGPFEGMYFTDSSGQDQGWRLVDLNGDGGVDLIRSAQGYPFQVLLNTGTGWAADSSSRFSLEKPLVGPGGKDVGARLADLNGDGLTDVVYGNPGQTEYAELWSSTTEVTTAAPPDLLIRVDNGIGGTTTLAYRPSTAYDNTGGDGVEYLPFVAQTVASQTISNGLGWSATTSFTYSGGKFDAAEREFLGFAYAKTTDPIGSTAETWFHQDPHLKGRPYKQEAKDSAGNLYSRTENSWACTDLFAGPGVHFCHLASTTATVFDGDATSKQTKGSYAYDDYGNVISQMEEGDTAVTGDERTTTTEYTLNPALWLMGFPSHTKTADSVGATLAESWIFYDGNAFSTDPPTKGLPTKTESWLSTGPPNPIATATYDAYGNKLTSTDPLGRTTTTTYDAQATFPIKVTNVLGHTLQTTYDPGTGAVLTTTDPNSQVTQNQYDALGRLTAVIGPQDTAVEPGVRYSFDLSSVPTRVTKKVKFTLNPPLFTSAYYTTYSFADGLGRTIQVRAPAEDSSKQIVTGNAELGSRGETLAQYLPRFESTSTSYSSPPAGTPKVLYEYDAMGRLVKTTDPDGAVSTATYSDWTVMGTDAKGNSTTKESDAFGRLIKVTESATSAHAAGITTYAYDTAGRLSKVTDASGNQTQMTYDSFGRKLTMVDPDMGSWSYGYDLTGNLVSQTDAKGNILTFAYDSLNRLTQKKGKTPTATTFTTQATYFYDSGTYANVPKVNLIGRLSKVTYPSGSTEFFYDLLGREIKTIKAISGIKFTFTVQREYDTLNRLTRLIYPDGTDLRHEYTPQGINRIYSVNADGSTVEYLINADSNAAGETLKMELGNGVTTDYTYDPNTLRIASIRTADSIGRTLQDLGYTFDAVGNLTTLADRVNSAGQSFQYDALNRLTGASGAYGSYSYRFDALGNLLSKDNGMALTYGPTNAKPHAVTKYVEPGKPAVNLIYDANGNLTKKGGQTFGYDVQNRLTQVVTPGPKAGTVTVTFQPGWNAVGFPFDFKDYSSTEVLKSLTLGTDYDHLVKPSVTTTPPTAPSSGTPSITLEFGKGFWIHVPGTSSVTLAVSGATPYPKKTISLAKGWNAVAVPTPVPSNLSAALSWLVSGTDYSQVQRWNPATQAFETLTSASTVNPGETLWVNMLRAKTWTPPTPIKNTRTDYAYDGDGGRVKVTVDGAITGTYVGELYESLPGSTTRSHIFLGSTRLATLERTPVILASADGGQTSANGTWYRLERALAKIDSTLTRSTPRAIRRALAAVEDFFVGKAYADTLPAGMALSFYHGDHLGSVNLITDHTGAQKELAEYSPFGPTVRAELVEARTPFGFTGKRLDSSTGLYYYGARYYDPELGRFIQPDTIVQAPSDPQTLNRYTYVRNNPLIYTDPTGHSFWKKVGKFLRQWVAPVAAVAVFFVSGGNVAAAAATYSYFATTGANLERGRGYFESVGRGALAAGATFAGAYIGGALIGGNFGVAVGAGAAGGASTAGLSGGNALLGAAAGAAAGAVGGLLGGIGGSLKGLAAIARAGAVGGASGAASGAIFGDAGGGAWRGAASAAAVALAVAIANGDFQRASDIGQKTDGALGKAAAEAKTASLAADKEQALALSQNAARNQREGGHVVGWRTGPGGEAIPIIADGSGRGQVGLDNYQDPLSAALNPALAQTVKVVGPEVGVQVAARVFGLPPWAEKALSVLIDVLTEVRPAY